MSGRYRHGYVDHMEAAIEAEKMRCMADHHMAMAKMAIQRSLITGVELNRLGKPSPAHKDCQGCGAPMIRNRHDCEYCGRQA